MTDKQLDPIHPGEILEEEFMRPFGLSANALAGRLDVPVTRISEIVRGRRGVTADTALRLGRFFQTSAELWMGLQSEYDLRSARRDVGKVVERQVQPMTAASVRGRTASESAASFVREAEPSYLAEVKQTRDRRRRRRPR